MTDAEHATRLRSALDAMPAIPPNSTLAAAIERAIELLEINEQSERIQRLVAERDAALAEVERLRALAYCDAGTDSEIPFRDLTQKYLPERDAWRAKYEALATEVGRAPESI